MLQLACKGDICNISGVGNTQKQSQMSIHTSISSRYTNYKADLTFIVLDNIAVPLPHNYIPTHTWHIPTKQAHTLADPTFFIPSSIDLLIGAELFYSILLTGRIKLGSCLPFLIETTLGWVVSGSYIPDSSELTSDCTTPVSMHLSSTPTDGILQSFWEQEEVLSTQKLISPEDKYCEELYTSTTTQDDTGRYTVDLPLQADKVNELGNSFNTAYHCLLKLESRLTKDPDLYTQYKSFINEFIELGHAHHIHSFSPTDSHAYYVPHLPVLKPDSASTKMRTVFNASAKSSSGLSLNDVLYEGPNIYNDIFDIILRFRLYKYAFSCDIVKMFRNIRINPQHTPLQRILWRNSKSEQLQCLELDTVTYGVKSAPYLACRTMLDLADRHTVTHPYASDCIKSSSYMDDYLCGAQSIEQCIQLCTELTDLLGTAGFQLHKWSTNHPHIYTHILSLNPSSQNNTPLDENNTYSFTLHESVKTLGLQWLPTQDTLNICIPNFTENKYPLY
ncbi:uncharacterized protein LOC126381063 [Pectinophora gossypiella]|uniref:uncharacterized protein LOC126381063 n=1 Tax=Pectinophora gossypiella TaxID=13191 RepID=UPI00214E25A1|nr:uncharacterized protein LOC126381063 [Pectinophora gossypiella]